MYSENLKKIRKVLDLSVGELAEIVDIPARTIGSYERNERKMSLELVTQLCKKLKINANWFFTGEGDMFNTLIISTTGKRIEKVMEDNNLSLSSMAMQLNISEKELSDLINDITAPDLIVLNTLRKIFNVSIDWILFGE